MKKIIATLCVIVCSLMNSFLYGQFDLVCDSMYTQMDTIELVNFQSSFDFNYQYAASNSGLDGGIYVQQFITFSDHSVVDSLKFISLQDPQQLPTYAYPDQTCNIDVIYSNSVIPINYFVDVTYNIYSGDTCKFKIVLKFNNSTGVKNLFNKRNVKISQNPTDGNFLLQYDGPNADDTKLEICNLIGQSIFAFSGISFNNQINLSNYPDGVYLIKLFNNDVHYLEKIILRR